MLKIVYDICLNDIVDLIIDQKIGAIYQGQSECGPRSLGNRSIIFDPRIYNGKQIVNTVKKREEFRPFAASVLEEELSNWFKLFGITSSPFMTFSFNILDHQAEKVPAIVHVDGTCRIQTVSENHNKNYYNLIKCFYNRTGVPMLLNTSFNLAGDPIVETVEDAIKTLIKSKLDYVYFPELKMSVLK
jgi:carbamoyltransferase